LGLWQVWDVSVRGVHRKERGHLEHLSVFGSIILKWILKINKMDVEGFRVAQDTDK